MVSRLDLAIIGALAAGCAFWIERGHRVIIDAPTQSELANAAAATAAACPDNDNVPYSLRCLAFLQGANTSGMRWRVYAEESVPTGSLLQQRTDIASLGPAAACPDTDIVPYSTNCLAYLQGATVAGMRWRVSAPAMPAAADAPTSVSAATSTEKSDNVTGARPRDLHASAAITPAAW